MKPKWCCDPSDFICLGLTHVLARARMCKEQTPAVSPSWSSVPGLRTKALLHNLPPIDINISSPIAVKAWEHLRLFLTPYAETWLKGRAWQLQDVQVQVIPVH